MSKRLILCDCSGSQSLDAAALEQAAGLSCSRIHSALCTRELPRAAEEIAAAGEGQNVIIACAQERTRFEELAGDLSLPAPLCVDLRDRAGWGEGEASAKMAALLAEAQLPRPEARSRDVESHGQCLVIGAGEVAQEAARTLSATLAVTLLQTDDSPPEPDRRFEIIRARITRLTGSLGRFALGLDQLSQLDPAGRGAFGFTAPKDGAKTECDVIVDLTGGAALFPAPEKRDGYFRADPKDPRAVAAMLAEAAQAVGVFEKPLYLRLDESLCAHGRAGQNGCDRCVTVCPTGAILPAGEHVVVDPLICAGCGACAALCPSAAISYDAPPPEDTLARIALLGQSYRAAGGSGARLLVHDDHGAEMISLAARFGRGLPAHVVPLHLPRLPLMGHAEMLAALACGFEAVDVVLSPKADQQTLAAEAELAGAMGAAGRIELRDHADPEALSEALYAADVAPLEAAPILPMGSRRQVARLAAKALDAPAAPLPEGAPYGALEIDTEACTLCLSCVSLCPSGALLDNPDMPQLRLQEDACLQCGLCSAACPEKAITLSPRFNPADEALRHVVLHEEEPYCCIECGAAFGVKSTVERIFETLAGKHPMFADGPSGRLIRMCDTCRVNAQYHSENNPFAQGARPAPITTDDYTGPRRDH